MQSSKKSDCNPKCDLCIQEMKSWRSTLENCVMCLIICTTCPKTWQGSPSHQLVLVRSICRFEIGKWRGPTFMHRWLASRHSLIARDIGVVVGLSIHCRCASDSWQPIVYPLEVREQPAALKHLQTVVELSVDAWSKDDNLKRPASIDGLLNFRRTASR